VPFNTDILFRAALRVEAKCWLQLFDEEGYQLGQEMPWLGFGVVHHMLIDRDAIIGTARVTRDDDIWLLNCELNITGQWMPAFTDVSIVITMTENL